MVRPIQLPVVSTTRIAISLGQEIGIEDVVRGLKRPRSRAIAAPAAYDILSQNATAVVDHSVSVPYEAVQNGTFEEQDEAVLSSTPVASYAETIEEFREAPKVVRTYTKKAKIMPVPVEKLRDLSPLFCSEEPLEVHGHLGGGLGDEAKARLTSLEAQITLPSEGRISPLQAKSRRELPDFPIEQGRDGTSTPNSDTIRKKEKRRTKANGKKRRVPVNELALVPSLPTHSTSSPAAKRNGESNVSSSAGGKGQHKETLDDTGLTLVGEIDGPLEQACPDVGRPQMPKEANVGKSVTRLGKGINMSHRHNISHEGFKFPPATPKAGRTPGWKLGSGFEGIKLENTTGFKATKAYPPKAQRVKHNRFQTFSIRSLKLSTTNLPSVQAKTPRTLSNGELLPTTQTAFERSLHGRKQNVALVPNGSKVDTINPEPGGEAIFDKVHALATLMRAQIKDADPRESTNPSTTKTSSTRLNRMTTPDTAESEDSRKIREPSKSEREGWLKRRTEVSFFIEANPDVQQGERSPPQKGHNHSGEGILDTHNATWYGVVRAKTRQTRPLQLRSNHVTQAEQTTESYRSDKCKTESLLGSDARLEKADEMVLNELVTDHECQTLQASRSMAMNAQLSSHPARSESIAPSSRFPVANSANPSEATEAQDSQGRRRKSSQLAVAEAEAYIQAHESLATKYGGQEEALDLGLSAYHQTPEASLGLSNYFSKAVQQLSSPDKSSHSVSRQKSHHRARDFIALKRDENERLPIGSSTQQGAHRTNATRRAGPKLPQTEAGNLKLGITPRLKRTMSSVPFRPPLKKLV